MKLTSYARREIGSSSLPSVVLTEKGFIGFNSPNEELDKAQDALQGKEAKNDLANNPKVQAGTVLEPAIFQLFQNQITEIARELPLEFGIPNEAYFYDVDGGKIGSSLDGIINIKGFLNLTDYLGTSHSLSGLGVVEIKNYSGAATDPVSEIYKMQVEAQMLTTKYQYGILVRLCRGWELQWFVFKPNKEMQTKLIDAATEFFYRLDGVMEGKNLWYKMGSSREASKFIKGNGSKEVVDLSSNNELPELIDDYQAAKKTISAGKKIEDDVSTRIKEILGANELAVCNGYEIKHTTTKRVKTKTIQLKDEPPSVSRRLTLKEING